MGGGEYGTAGSAQVLEGYTIATTVGLIEGAMRRNGLIDAELTTQNASYSIPEGYHDGTGKVTANITGLIPANIKKGVNVGGVEGTYEGSGGDMGDLGDRILCVDNKFLYSYKDEEPTDSVHYRYNKNLDKLIVRRWFGGGDLVSPIVRNYVILAQTRNDTDGRIDFSKYNTLTIKMKIWQYYNSVNGRPGYRLRILCAGNTIYEYVADGTELLTYNKTFDISHINTEGSLVVRLDIRSDKSSVAQIDSYEITELELK